MAQKMLKDDMPHFFDIKYRYQLSGLQRKNAIKDFAGIALFFR